MSQSVRHIVIQLSSGCCTGILMCRTASEVGMSLRSSELHNVLGYSQIKDVAIIDV